MDPVKARRQVFTIAHERALPTTPEAREAALRHAASKLEVTVEELVLFLGFGELSTYVVGIPIDADSTKNKG